MKIGDLVMLREHSVPRRHRGGFDGLGVIIGPAPRHRKYDPSVVTVAWTDGTYTVTRSARLKPYEGDAGDINTLIKQTLDFPHTLMR